MGIYENFFFQFLKCVGKTTIIMENVIISGHKGDPNEVETFQLLD